MLESYLVDKAQVCLSKNCSLPSKNVSCVSALPTPMKL